MKQTKTSSLYRLVAFLLITIVMIGIVGVVADGARTKDPSDNAPPTDNLGSETDKNDGTTNEESDQSTIPESPKYTHYLTGLVTDEARAAAIPLVYTVDPASALYGISQAFLTVELATELGGSRMLLFTEQNAALGKIGALAPTRGYISNIVSYFGGILVHDGEEGKKSGNEIDLGTGHIDLGKTNKYTYSEGSRELYTNAQLMASALDAARIPTRYTEMPLIPFTFRQNAQASGTRAMGVTVPYGTDNEVSLLYDSVSAAYTMYRGAQLATDPLYRTEVRYQNVLILFCDAVTYEGADHTETVLDTASGGSGYYFSMGAYQRILWSTNEDGCMAVTDSTGTPLLMNPGSTYVSFFKAADKNRIVIER